MLLSNSSLEEFIYCPSRLRSLNDEDLVAAFRAGCNDALAVLFERHGALVLRRARSILLDDSAAEDIVREVFMDAFQAVNKFNPSGGNLQLRLLQYAYARIMKQRKDLQGPHLKELLLLEDEIIRKPVGKTLKDIRRQKGLSIDEALEGVRAADIDLKQLSRALGLAIKQSREERHMSRRELSRKTGFPLGRIIRLEGGVAGGLPVTEFIRISFALEMSPEILAARFHEFHRNSSGEV